jgi:SpoVK/Ycf46/Vps4 family AAA+-type ATPase
MGLPASIGTRKISNFVKTNTLKTPPKLREHSETIGMSYQVSSRSWIMDPIRAAFGAGAVHYCSGDGPWDTKRIAETLPEKLVRSWYCLREDAEKGHGYWWDLCLQLDERLFVRVDDDSISVYAESPETARTTVEKLARTFRKVAEPKSPTFQIVKQSDGEIETEAVKIDQKAGLTSEDLVLHYGEDFPTWHASFLDTLKSRPRGLTIMDGPPGTGKTSYLRQVMVDLKDSHRFYFISSANLRLLRDAEFVNFWASERRVHEGTSMVVILEDAETALMPRSWDNRQEVSLLLSLTDGILGEFLKLQIICTINCDIQQIDSALTRPGRLVAHRHFSRMSRERAEKIAAKLNRALPQATDYSLAEVFSGQLEQVSERPSIGFGAQP